MKKWWLQTDGLTMKTSVNWVELVKDTEPAIKMEMSKHRLTKGHGDIAEIMMVYDGKQTGDGYFTL